MGLSWFYLIIATLAEGLFGIFLYHSRGFSVPVPSVLAVLSAISTTWLLALAMKELPMGLSFVIWSGVGALIIVLYGIFALGEPASLARVGMMAMIMAGVVGLKITSAH